MSNNVIIRFSDVSIKPNATFVNRWSSIVVIFVFVNYSDVLVTRVADACLISEFLFAAVRDITAVMQSVSWRLGLS